MCYNDVKGWVNTPDPSSSPCTIHISLSALIIHAQTLWENRVEAVGAEGGTFLLASYELPISWLTDLMESNRRTGERWSDMTNNFHYVSVTLSHWLINSPLAVICHYALDRGGTSQVISLHWLQLGMGGIAREERVSKYCWSPSIGWGLAAETNISVCFCTVRFVYPLSQLLFMDHSLLPDAICLSFSLPHSCELFCLKFCLYCCTMLCRIS